MAAFDKNLKIGEMEFEKIPPILRAVLMSDGTVTKILEAYYWEPIQVKRLLHVEHPAEKDIPPLEIKAGDSVLHRRVLMQGLVSNQIYGQAESFICAGRLWPGIRDDLLQGRLGIGELLRDKRMETYREVLAYESGSAGEWGADLNCRKEDRMITRSYRIIAGGKPSLFIIDRFPIRHFETKI
ncbi:MAG TPA: chorismate pyruvate-lyase family protein [Candidatus Methylacidiphilales bacterium]|nr:chorismate pyruvate-lyase family protein [Candidatus Methylacidiphilales bacterium]